MEKEEVLRSLPAGACPPDEYSVADTDGGNADDEPH
jgi:hypothetical protein